MKKILITGSNGLLGQKVVYGLLGDSFCLLPDDLRKQIKGEVQIIATAKGENRLNRKDGYIYESLDITNKAEVEKVFSKCKPDVVINTAAMTNVDACETKREECWLANVTAVQNIVDALTKLPSPVGEGSGVRLIHISTDFVFDGMKGAPYDENDKPNPLHYYALSKLEGEKIVMKSKLKWAILRTIIVYGVVDGNTRSNLVLWVKNNLEKKQKINVINDQYRAPTLSEDLAQGCILAAMKGAEGIYHVSGKETFSILDLAYQIADFWKLDRSFINPVSSEQLNQPAKRPPYTGFIIDKAKRELEYHPRSFTEGLKIVDEQLKPYN
ncbi:MAG: NAD(P)-dependent oxidoreductase [Bacteroidetes bacterium]|nr:NAD(P)-dependent oxidoreductase [Bacteroidota bacterium]